MPALSSKSRLRYVAVFAAVGFIIIASSCSPADRTVTTTIVPRATETPTPPPPLPAHLVDEPSETDAAVVPGAGPFAGQWKLWQYKDYEVQATDELVIMTITEDGLLSVADGCRRSSGTVGSNDENLLADVVAVVELEPGCSPQFGLDLSRYSRARITSSGDLVWSFVNYPSGNWWELHFAPHPAKLRAEFTG